MTWAVLDAHGFSLGRAPDKEPVGSHITAKWQNRSMSSGKRVDYAFLVVSLLSLAGGLIASATGLVEVSPFIYGVGALVGVGLSTTWLIRAIRDGEMGSDLLAVISIVATALTSEWLAASVIAVMLATGRALEQWAEGAARQKLEALLKRAPQLAHRVRADGYIEDVPLSAVRLQDRLMVRSGEVVPIDGILLGEATFDESALTGEPLPRFRLIGEEVASGVLNSSNSVEIRATRTAETSTYSNLVRLVQQAQASSATGVRLANKWAVRFVPLALAIAGLTWLLTGEVERAVAVIVAATPCPLILAVPVAIISGMSKASSLGAIIKGGAALENLARAETVLLDKTGTLTHGGPVISEFAFSPELGNLKLTEDDVIALAASLEQASPHIVARALVAESNARGMTLMSASEVVERHGVGLVGKVNGHEVSVGQPEDELTPWSELNNALLVAVRIDGKAVAMIGLDDPIREEAAETVANMRALGVRRILLVTGDRKITADEVGAQVQADAVFAECKPEDKLRIVEDEMLATNGSVIAVGDGINDAPALAAASVGVAMGARGATAASEAADVVIVEDSIKHLAVAIDVARGARRRALQASGLGMSLALGAMLLGSFGLFNATASAIAQEFIDAAAILWAIAPVALRTQAK